jgi:hypothetical protein
MRVLLKSNDPVLLNFAEVLLKDAGIPATVLDGAMSILEGSVGVLPRRMVVADGDEAAARAILTEGVGAAVLEPVDE